MSSGAVIGYSEFLDEVAAKRIKSVVLQEGQGGTEIIALTNDDKRIRATATYLDRGLVGDLRNNGVKFDVKPREEPSLLVSLLVSWGPMLLASSSMRALLLPKLNAPPLPPPCIWRMKYTQTPISNNIGPQLTSRLTSSEGSSRGLTSNLTPLLRRSPTKPRSR